jgi:hypothetical protein
VALFAIEDPDEKRIYFEEEISYINNILQGKDETEEE